MPNPSDALFNILQEKTKTKPMSFAEYMQLVLYHPEWGYYCNGRAVIGEKGDFVTAPSIGQSFSKAITLQFLQIFESLENPAIVELGAGRGQMAAGILETLALHQHKNVPYYILEISPHLIKVQKAAIQSQCPSALDHVHWIKSLDELPKNFEGVVVGNEFLDALPVEIFKIDEKQKIQQGQVELKDQALRLTFNDKPSTDFIEAVQSELDELTEPLPIGYLSEINLNLNHWHQAIAQVLSKGVVFWVDYGFSRHEYFHTQRSEGTIMCHHQHTTHSDYFHHMGLQDVTAHVNFSHVAQTAFDNGFDILGYTNQAAFLLALNILNQTEPQDLKQQTLNSQELQVLLQPHEMGELFKVIALGKNIDVPLLGFSLKDYTYKL